MSSPLRFVKMHGLGNDFVVFDARDQALFLSAKDCAAIANRKKGVGCDQLIVLEPSERADLFMRIFNADGSEAEACGNATRCVAQLLMQERGQQNCTIETLAGLLPATKQGELITVNMGPARQDWRDIPLSKEQDTLALDLEFESLSAPVAVNMGNPHCCWFVPSVESARETGLYERMGAWVQSHALFPERSNTHLVEVVDRNTIKMLIWERGVGPTEASGSSACAGAVAAIRKGYCASRVRVLMPGGEAQITWQADGTVLMQGPYAFVFEGRISLPLTA